MTELLVLAALLSAPEYRVRDAATRALAARGPAALPVLDALAASDDPEVAVRAGSARYPAVRAVADRFLAGPGAPDEAEVRFWADPANRDVLECASRRYWLPGSPWYWPLSWQGDWPRSVRAVAGWCRNQAAYPPGCPMRWPWPVSWEFCTTGWKW